jgi:hypothetical protein
MPDNRLSHHIGLRILPPSIDHQPPQGLLDIIWKRDGLLETLHWSGDGQLYSE